MASTSARESIRLPDASWWRDDYHRVGGRADLMDGDDRMLPLVFLAMPAQEVFETVTRLLF